MHGVTLPFDGGTVDIDLRDPGGLHLATWGPMRMQPLALRLWNGLLRIPDWDVVVDVGANYGEFAVPAAARFGSRLLAVEPNPLVNGLLTRSIHRAHPQSTSVCCLAGERSGVALLDLSGNSRWGHALALEDGVVNPVLAPVVPIDDLLQVGSSEEVSVGRLLMKIDVEGAELAVLAGAAGVLREAAGTALLVEAIHVGVEELIEALPGYEAFGLHRETSQPIPLSGAGNGFPADVNVRDVLFTRGIDIEQVAAGVRAVST